jgi:hypothetical protein
VLSVFCCHWSSPQYPVLLPSSYRSIHSQLPW